MGVGPARVRDLFAQARAQSPSIIFIGETCALCLRFLITIESLLCWQLVLLRLSQTLGLQFTSLHRGSDFQFALPCALIKNCLGISRSSPGIGGCILGSLDQAGCKRDSAPGHR